MNFEKYVKVYLYDVFWEISESMHVWCILRSMLKYICMYDVFWEVSESIYIYVWCILRCNWWKYIKYICLMYFEK